MDLGLNGRRALVLGGSKGLGRAIAESLAGDKAVVAVAARDRAALDDTVATMRRTSPGSLGIRADLAEAGAVDAIRDQALAGLGGVDILVLNGGGPPPSQATAIDPDIWRRQFESMVLGHMRLATGLLPAMRQQHWGRIIIVASTSIREPIAGLTISNALRAAVAGWAKTLAREVASDGVTVNLILPGSFATDRIQMFDRMDAEARGVDMATIAAENQAGIPIGRYGQPKEFAAMATFLASDLASYVTGAAIAVDGGIMQSML